MLSHVIPINTNVDTKHNFINSKLLMYTVSLHIINIILALKHNILFHNSMTRVINIETNIFKCEIGIIVHLYLIKYLGKYKIKIKGY